MKKTAVITGSSRGIGRAIALAFAKKGYNVVINSKTTVEQGQKTANECAKHGVGAIYVCADVSTALGAKKLAETAINTFGKIDVLVNNAGVAQSKLLIDATEDDVKNILFHNIACPVFCCKEFIPNMLSNGGGAIINISSMLTKAKAAMESLYATSKSGIIGLTQALACEYGGSNIRVNAIAPGFINTDMTNCFSVAEKAEFAQNTPLGRIGKPNDIAGIAVFLASKQAQYITGATIYADGGVTLA